MTTIVYSAGLIAYDSRLTAGGAICTDAAEKMRIVDGHRFFLCGATCDYADFIAIYFGAKIDKKLDVSAIVVTDEKQVLLVGHNQADGMWKTPTDNRDGPIAIGSGSAHALTAIDMGADVRVAVKMAAKRDSGTGGKVRVYRVHDGD